MLFVFNFLLLLFLFLLNTGKTPFGYHCQGGGALNARFILAGQSLFEQVDCQAGLYFGVQIIPVSNGSWVETVFVCRVFVAKVFKAAPISWY